MEEKIYYIYVHLKKGTDIPFYIGRGQRTRISQKQSRNRIWHNIVKKYNGFDYFKIEENLTNDEANMFEEFYILLFKSWGFKLANIESGGKSSKRPDVSERLKVDNPMFNKETKDKMSLIHKGKIISEEHRKKISDKLKGNITWMKGNKNGSFTKGKMIKNCILDPETGIFYNSSEAAELTGYDVSHLMRCLKGERKNNKIRLRIV